ncbi:substrate-binding domain-containing protein [Lentzea atacamensis]|uniref:substrate-binding domain-containing protein n=1 Tax=Lentzea atacamensis TaxID=531938 RepID=UPI0039898AE9
MLAAARQHGLRVPQDLLVACISEDPDYATTTPAVTTVSLRSDQVGDEAVDLLIALINARTGVERRRLVQPVLTPRYSTRHKIEKKWPLTCPCRSEATSWSAPGRIRTCDLGIRSDPYGRLRWVYQHLWCGAKFDMGLCGHSFSTVRTTTRTTALGASRLSIVDGLVAV